MRIAMIGQKGMPATHGGVERHVHDLALRLVGAGHKVVVYSRSWYTQKTGDMIIDGVNIKHLPSLNTKNLDTFTHTLISTLHAITRKYDVIHYHGVGPALLSWIPRVFARKTKVITTFHSIDRYHQKWGAIAKLMLRMGEKAAVVFAHETITVSRSLQTYCVNEFGVDTTYIPNGIEANGEKPKAEFLKQFGLEPGKYILMVSRLVPHKGAHILVEAFTKLKQSLDNENTKSLKLVIVGGSVYTNKYVKNLHEQASFCNDIIFTDFQSGETLSALYAHARALVHPSLNEGLPITVLEAMNSSQPVLLSNIPEHLELVSDSRMIFKQNDSLDLANKMKWFLTLSRADQESIGNENVETVERKYRWDAIVPRIINLYERKQTKLSAAKAGMTA